MNQDDDQRHHEFDEESEATGFSMAKPQIAKGQGADNEQLIEQVETRHETHAGGAPRRGTGTARRQRACFASNYGSRRARHIPIPWFASSIVLVRAQLRPLHRAAQNRLGAFR
jgi:hypothetical protein